MNQPRRHSSFATLTALASALLWGVVEVLALARSRWSMRLRRTRGLPSQSHRA